jgi:hypothetical protein
MVVTFPELPNGVTLLNPSGTHANGAPYLNLRDALGGKDLAAGETSTALQVVLENPSLTQFDLQSVVLVGERLTAPALTSLQTLTVKAGERLELPMQAVVNGTTYNLRLGEVNQLPTGRLTGNNKLIFQPTKPNASGSK